MASRGLGGCPDRREAVSKNPLSHQPQRVHIYNHLRARDLFLARLPIRSRFWLEWDSCIAGPSLPVARSRSPSIPARSPRGPSQPVDVTTAGPSTPQTAALAVICSGRDDRVGEILVHFFVSQELEARSFSLTSATPRPDPQSPASAGSSVGLHRRASMARVFEVASG